MKLKSFCTMKEMVSKLKRQLREWEKTFTRQVIDNQNIQGAQKTKLLKINEEMGK
jgi:hypothetical protein